MVLPACQLQRTPSPVHPCQQPPHPIPSLALALIPVLHGLTLPSHHSPSQSLALHLTNRPLGPQTPPPPAQDHPQRPKAHPQTQQRHQKHPQKLRKSHYDIHPQKPLNPGETLPAPPPSLLRKVHVGNGRPEEQGRQYRGLEGVVELRR
jgi:hypothetical protein